MGMLKIFRDHDEYYSFDHNERKYEEAKRLHNLGYSTAGFVEEIYEGAEVVIVSAVDGPKGHLHGRVLHVKTIDRGPEDGPLMKFVLEDGDDGTQIPLTFGGGHEVRFRDSEAVAVAVA